MCQRIARTRRSSEGFTLVEVLAAIAIFSLGILGLAALQLTALRSDRESTLRWQASMLAYDMADRLYVNPAAALAGFYSGNPSSSPPTCEGVSVSCTPAQVADYDKASWVGGLAALPGGAGIVTASGGGEFTVTVRWDARRTGATGTNCPPLSEADLRCFEVEVAL